MVPLPEEWRQSPEERCDAAIAMGWGPEGMWLKNARKIGDKQHQTPSGTPWYQHLFIVLRVFKDLFNWFSHFS